MTSARSSTTVASSSSSPSSSTCTASRTRSSCPARHLDGLVEDGAGFAGFAAGDIGQKPSDPDMAAMPDLESLTVLPVAPERRALRMRRDRRGRGVALLPAHDPAQPARARRREGLGVQARRRARILPRAAHRGRRHRGRRPARHPRAALYDMRALTRNLDFVSEVSRHITELGWDNYATDHEDANGQFEQNFNFADALTTADRAIFFRYMVESLAQERGLIATFMPKPFAHLTGNGCHFHMSLWDGDKNLFEDPGRPEGHGLVQLAYDFIGGLKAHAKAYIAVTAPTVTPTSGSRRRADERRHVGARLHRVRLEQPHDDAAHPRRRAHRGPHRRRLVQPVPRRHRGARGGDGRHRARPRPGRADDGQPLRDARGRTLRGRASSCSRRTCSTRPASSRSATSCARPSAAPATRTTSTTSPLQAARVAAGARADHRSGSLTATCSCTDG